LALAVPLSRFTSRVGGGSVLAVRRLRIFMNTPHSRTLPWWAVTARWAARVLCTLGVVMLLVLIFGKNSMLWRIPGGSSHPINLMFLVLLKGSTPFVNPASRGLVGCATTAMLLMLVGLIAGWWRDGLAALLILTGWVLFEVAEKYVPLWSWFHLAAIAGVLFGMAWVGGQQWKPVWSLGILAFPVVLGLLINLNTIRLMSGTVSQHEVGKPASEFPEQLDLSSPATASAAMWQAYARMDTQTISQISFNPINPQQYEDWFEKEQHRDHDGMAIYLKAKIIAVQTWRDVLASVITYIPFAPGTDRMRYDDQNFIRVNGRWKYLWEERLPDLAVAKLRFESEDSKKRDCQALTEFGDEADQRAATSPAQAQIMKLVQNYFHFHDPNIAFRLSIKWGDGQTNLDGNSSIRYKYRAELWNGGDVTNDQVFTFAQNRFVSVKDVSLDASSTAE
jgi:hypothetical protein